MNEQEAFDDELYGDDEEIMEDEEKSAIVSDEVQLHQIPDEEEIIDVNSPEYTGEEEVIITPNFPDIPQEPDLRSDEILSEILFFGSVSEAVQSAISKQTFLLVILNGGNKESESLLNRIRGSKEIQELLKDLISLHLFTGTENFDHFIQICKKKKIVF